MAWKCKKTTIHGRISAHLSDIRPTSISHGEKTVFAKRFFSPHPSFQKLLSSAHNPIASQSGYAPEYKKV